MIGEMRKSRLKLLSLGLLTCGVMMSVTACKKDTSSVDVESTPSVEDVQDAILEHVGSTTSSTLETNVQEIEPEKETVMGIEVSEDESRKIDKIIEQLREDVNREPIPVDKIDGLVEPERETSEQDIIDKENKDWENSIRESLGVETEPYEESTEDLGDGDNSDSESGSDSESAPIENERPTHEAYDADGNEKTREVKGFEEETKPVVGDDGAIVETPEYLISKAKLEGSGPRVGKNTSEDMKVGSVYNYFFNDGTKRGKVGDFVMCGKLAINVAPAMSEVGYDIESSNNTVSIKSNVGDVHITLLKTTDLDVEKMTLSQMNRLSGMNLNTVYMNATKGSYGSYSQCLTDTGLTNGVQYYSCPFGIYEIKYNAIKGMVHYLINVVYPESSLNELVVTG